MGQDCIIWKGKTRKKYGIVRKYVLGKKIQFTVHRLEWEKHNGPIPKGMLVCHRCDNPPCYNINHLWLGTQKENMEGMRRKKRHPAIVLTERDVAAIKNMILLDFGTSWLARKYGVSRRAITLIKSGRNWKHVVV